MGSDLESRIRQLEDRTLIGERVVSYAVAVDNRHWEMLTKCFTDPVYAEFPVSGTAKEFSRAELVALIRGAISGFTHTQHLSPNHIIEFPHDDPDRAVCHSYMYAQHYLQGSTEGDFFLLRGSYTNHMCRTDDGWRIERLIQHPSWSEGNKDALSEAKHRLEADGPGI
jgi:hypothetical protein